ncbi:MAG: ATP-binding protein [Eubacteriales bacterium]|nr:ATP-binding protein [Eubacteriales bacterium]
MKTVGKGKTGKITLKGILGLFKRTQLIIIVSLAVILGVSGTIINIHFETERRDQNLKNVAEAVANSPELKLKTSLTLDDTEMIADYLDALKGSLSDIDVISIVNMDRLRIYHSNHTLIGTEYDGNFPDHTTYESGYYAFNETGASGRQRRAYAAIYNNNGEYIGFVMAIMLMKNIRWQTAQILFLSLLLMVVVILIEMLLADSLAGKLKDSLNGYEPDVFTAMYNMRDGILETLSDGILGFDNDGIVQFANTAAVRIVCGDTGESIIGKSVDSLGEEKLAAFVHGGTEQSNISIAKGNIILDCTPILEDGRNAGMIAVLHNRAEYTKLMEELSGTQYLVDSMRANNHDFTNKLHVILGLIQMEMYDEASSYIQNITMVQRETISRVMNAVSAPAVAALLIGKIARASELNVKFILRDGSHFSQSDSNLPSEMLITVIGNLLDNAYDSMNDDYKENKELLFGIYSKPGAVLITVDDTGSGIKPSDMDHIFENGYSTKGTGRGTGLYQVKGLIEDFGGKISVESQEGVGTSFSVSFTKEK